VHPEYYCLMMFAQTVPARSRLLRLSGATGGRMRAWATLAPDGKVRVVLINEDSGHSRVVTVRVPSMSAPGTLERLEAPSIHASTV
jgi:hypothetical protein